MKTSFDRIVARKREAEIVRSIVERDGNDSKATTEALLCFEAGEHIEVPYESKGCSSYTPDELRDHMGSGGAGTSCHSLTRASSIIEPAEPDMASRRRLAPRHYRRVAQLIRANLITWCNVAASGDAFILLVTGGGEVLRGAAASLLLDALASRLGPESVGSFEDYGEVEGSYRASTLFGSSNDWAILEPAKNASVLALHGIEAAVRGRAQLRPLYEILRYRVNRFRPLVLTSALPAHELGAELEKPRLAPEGTDVLRYLAEFTRSTSGIDKEMLVDLDVLCPSPLQPDR